MLNVIGIIITLVVMEGLLSFDNALVLAIMARKVKDPKSQKKTLLYGMWGAVAFRAIFIALGVVLIKLWFIKIIGAIYLGKIVFDHFSGKDEEDEDEDGMLDKYQDTFMHKMLKKVGIHLSLFWSVVVSIELMDLAFSVDSILAALALSDKFFILLTGGFLGILMMRGVASIFIKLIEKVPEMEHTAFVLIAIIAVRMFLETLPKIIGLFGVDFPAIEIGNGILFTILGVTFFGTFVIHYLRKNKAVTQ